MRRLGTWGRMLQHGSELGGASRDGAATQRPFWVRVLAMLVVVPPGFGAMVAANILIAIAIPVMSRVGYWGGLALEVVWWGAAGTLGGLVIAGLLWMVKACPVDALPPCWVSAICMVLWLPPGPDLSTWPVTCARLSAAAGATVGALAVPLLEATRPRVRRGTCACWHGRRAGSTMHSTGRRKRRRCDGARAGVRLRRSGAT